MILLLTASDLSGIQHCMIRWDQRILLKKLAVFTPYRDTTLITAA
jgi:hypothetical protein